MNPFLEDLASEILDKHHDLSKVFIVLPSQRAVVYLKHHLKKLTERTIWMPNIFTIDQFIKSNSKLRGVSGIELLVHFYETYILIEKDDAESFDSFSKWAPTLLADFNEIDYYLSNEQTVFNDLKNIKEIDQWSFNLEELTDIQKKFSLFWNKLTTYYNELNQLLLAKELGYNGMIYKQVANSIFEVVDFYEPKSVYFAGFNALSNSEKQIIQTFVSSGKGQFIIDGDPFYIENEHHEAGYFIRKNLNTSFLNSNKWVKNHYLSDKKEINIIASPSNVNQAKICGNILQSLSQAEIDKTAIVLADETLLTPVLNSIPASIEKYNVSMGYNLFQTPIGNLVQLIFSIQENYIKYNGQLYHASLLKIIDHYLLKFKKKGEAIKHDITKYNRLFLSPKYISKQSALAGIIPLITQWNSTDLFNQSKDCFNWLINFIKTTANPNKDSIELEYVFSLQQLIIKLDKQLANTNYINDLSTLKNLYNRQLKSEVVSFIGEPLEGLQIIGMLETRSLDFENIIMLSVNEDILPKSEGGNSFIPYELKKLYGLPTFKEKESIYANHFYRLLQRAKQTHLIYNESTSGIGPSEKSRYINQIKEELPVYTSSITVKELTLNIPASIQPIDEISLNNSPDIVYQLNQINEKGFSPTALRTFINCKLDFYYKYIVGIREEDEVNETIEANTLGSIIHKVLEDLYKPLLNQLLIIQDIDKLLASYEKMLEKEFASQYAVDYKTGKNFLLFNAAKNTIKTFLNQEKEIIKKHELIVIGLEEKFTKTTSVNINGEPKDIRFRGTIDRIDSLDGNIRLIDYKTGKVESRNLSLNSIEDAFSKPDKEKAFQLLLYKILVEEHYQGQEITPGIISFKSLQKGLFELNIKHDTEDSIYLFNSLLANLLQETYDLSTVFEHREDSKYCKYC